jgi:nucleoside-diphosphate-sugar epimerase
VKPRVETERLIVAANSDRVRTIVMRSGCVYGGAGSLTASWFASAQREGVARIVGDGNFRWAMVHITDVAEWRHGYWGGRHGTAVSCTMWHVTTEVEKRRG